MRYPLNNVGYSVSDCGCGCGGNGNCGSNNKKLSYNQQFSRAMNGEIENSIANLIGNVGSGNPLATINIGLDNDTLMKMGFGALALMFINKEVNKR